MAFVTKAISQLDQQLYPLFGLLLIGTQTGGKVTGQREKERWTEWQQQERKGRYEGVKRGMDECVGWSIQ